MFVLESSSAVGFENWGKLKIFTQTIVSQFDLESEALQFGVVSYGTEAYVDIKLNEFSTTGHLASHIENMFWKEGSRNTADGLHKTRIEVLLESNGDRPLSPNLVILVVSGSPADAELSTLTEGFALNFLQDTNLMIIKVSDAADVEVFGRIASSPEYLLEVGSFDGLMDVGNFVLETIRGALTPDTTTFPPTSPTTQTTTTQTSATGKKNKAHHIYQPLTYVVVNTSTNDLRLYSKYNLVCINENLLMLNVCVLCANVK